MQEESKRNRAIYSISRELIHKSREAALAAVQIFNNPQITFKSEIFIVLMHIAWTYLLHAYYRNKKIEYRYFDKRGTRKHFKKTNKGAYKYWELERCLNDDNSPVDKNTANNLRFLIGIRHEIEHQMTQRIDASLSAKFQACCLNYNEYIKNLFGKDNSIDKHLAFSLQFSSISHDQVELLQDKQSLPSHIKSFIEGFENSLSEEEYNNQKFAYRVLFVAKTANHKGQADRVIEFIKSDTEFAKNVNIDYALIKETERNKYLPKTIVQQIQEEGFTKFRMHEHTLLWKGMDAKNPSKKFGTLLEGNWYWYDSWLQQVREYCKNNAKRFK